jgi:hypothetical protein
VPLPTNTAPAKSWEDGMRVDATGSLLVGGMRPVSVARERLEGLFYVVLGAVVAFHLMSHPKRL